MMRRTLVYLGLVPEISMADRVENICLYVRANMSVQASGTPVRLYADRILSLAAGEEL